jgi:hypothetical protein
MLRLCKKIKPICLEAIKKMSNYINDDGKKFCGFCAKTEDEVYLLQAGPICQICDECVDVAYNNITMKKMRDKTKEMEDFNMKKVGIAPID